MERGPRLVLGSGPLCTDRVQTRVFPGMRLPCPSPDNACREAELHRPPSPVPTASVPGTPGRAFLDVLTVPSSPAPGTHTAQPPQLLEAHTGSHRAYTHLHLNACPLRRQGTLRP